MTTVVPSRPGPATAALSGRRAATFRVGEAACSPPTFGVEEEFALVDPATGRVVPHAAEVIRDCHRAHSVVEESMAFMIETRTPVCRTLDEVRQALWASRSRVVAAARRHGLVVVASGVPPFGIPMPPPVTPAPRYLDLVTRFPFAMSTAGTCGCHVHVAVPTRQAGVEALLRVRRWLPALLALTANSPIWDGRPTGWASTRYLFSSRWPTAVPPPPVRSGAEYDALVHAAITSGEALDLRSVYFLARLSPRYPTIEVRIGDMSLTVDETVAYAGLVRALVAKSIDDAIQQRPAAPVMEETLGRACRVAAREGVSGVAVDVLTDEEVPGWELIDALIADVLPFLRIHGDEERVLATLYRLRIVGGGADRQRKMFIAAPSPQHFLTALAGSVTAALSAS